MANLPARHSPPQAAYPSDWLYRLSSEQYHFMLRSSIIFSSDPIDFVEGLLLFNFAETEIHRHASRRLTDRLVRQHTPGWGIDLTSGVTLSDGEPKPDAMVVRGSTDDYDAEYPTPKDVGLLFEVADQTLSRDRGIKLRSYARAGIVCYWIINLIDRQIEVHTQPDAKAEVPTYRDRQVFKPGQRVPLVIEQKTIAEIAVDDLLPA